MSLAIASAVCALMPTVVGSGAHTLAFGELASGSSGMGPGDMPIPICEADRYHGLARAICDPASVVLALAAIAVFDERKRAPVSPDTTSSD